MDEAWYVVEQQIRERHAAVREAARIQALTGGRRRKTDSSTANVAEQPLTFHLEERTCDTN